jgi:hypothetical protein
MKKIIVIAALSLLAATPAFADLAASGALVLTSTGLSVYGSNATGAVAVGTTPLIGKTSTGVGFGWKTGAGGYAILTQHKSGTRIFGSSHDSTSIVYKDTAPGVIPASSDTPSVSDFTAFGGWTSM